MKKCTLFLMVTVACVSFSFAQVLKINQMETNDAMERVFIKEIQPGDTIEMVIKEDFITFDSDVINTSYVEQTVNLLFEVSGETEGIEISGCWDMCNNPGNYKFGPVDISAQGEHVFNIDYKTNGIENSQALITCTFSVAGYDDVVFYVKFGNVETSVTEPVIAKNQAYPNPASAVVNINYALNKRNARISLYNILGVSVYEQQLDGQEGTIAINVSDLAQGIYFYTIKVDGNVVDTKKLVISR